MKRITLALALCAIAPSGFAAVAGGEGCGWGQIMFEGQSGKASHVLALTTNGTSGNNTFGVTTGTNGCSSSGTISYGGKEMVDVSGVMDEFGEDLAQGDGEVITTVAVSIGISQEHREAFKLTMRDNFDTILPSKDVTMEEVYAAIFAVMAQDETLKEYT
jgi:hypothetical protein